MARTKQNAKRSTGGDFVPSDLATKGARGYKKKKSKPRKLKESPWDSKTMAYKRKKAQQKKQQEKEKKTTTRRRRRTDSDSDAASSSSEFIPEAGTTKGADALSGTPGEDSALSTRASSLAAQSPSALPGSELFEPSTPASDLAADHANDGQLAVIPNLNKFKSPQRNRWYGEGSYDEHRQAMSSHLRELQTAAHQIPYIESLPPSAIGFLVSIFGDNDNSWEDHAAEPVSSFVSVVTSMKVAAISNSRLDDGTPRLTLRYFAGLGARTDRRNHPNIKLFNYVKKFFSREFDDYDRVSIDKCISRARTLYITAWTEKVSSDGEREERIVAAMNFAAMANHGFYVNWLLTSDENIHRDTYGERFEIEAAGGTWRKRHLALLLFKVANLAVSQHVSTNFVKIAPDYKEPDGYFVVLQARTHQKETAHKYYRSIGFEEVGFFDADPELKINVFPSFPDVINDAQDDLKDFIHFIRDVDKNPDLAIFRNSTGTFFKVKGGFRLTKNYEDVRSGSSVNEFSFPFACSIEHLMLLSSGLVYYFLPFNGDRDGQDFITPNNMYHQFDRCIVSERARSTLFSGAQYLSDEIIDFYFKW
jgi:hypothetical protein